MRKIVHSFIGAFLCCAAALAQNQVENATLTGEEKAAFIEKAVQLLVDKYIFTDVAQKIEKEIKDKAASGAFDQLTNPERFAERLTQELQAISHDKHMVVFVTGNPPSPSPDPAAPLLRGFKLQRVYKDDNCGFSKIEKLEGNVGYLAVIACLPLSEAKEYADLAMKYLSGSDALIIDLRENEGGAKDIIHYLLGYFFEKATHLNSFYFRKYDRTVDFHSSDKVGGETMPDVSLFVLTSRRTFSAAEEFAYDIQTLKRGTLVGETTGGGANPGRGFPVTDRFALFVPLAKAINPVTKGNWEGVGVIPEIKCAADRALDTAIPLAREAALARREKMERSFRESMAATIAEMKAIDRLFDEGKIQDAGKKLEEVLSNGIKNGSMNEGVITQYGRDQLGAGKTLMAYALLKMNAASYPNSARARNVLGEACERLGKMEEALESYQKAVILGTESKDIQTDTFIENRDRVKLQFKDK